jgi:WD40 repeat protein
VLGWTSRHDADRAVARERADARRRHRRLAFLAVGAVIGLAFAGVLTAWAFAERDRARRHAVEARAHELEARAVTLMPTDTSLAVALAAEAARTAPSNTAEDILRQALMVDRLLGVVPAGGPVVDVEAGSGGRFFAATTEGHARRYDAGTSENRPEADLETRYRSGVTAVGPDRSGMLSASLSGIARRTSGLAGGPSGGNLTLRHGEPVVAIEPVACRVASGCLLTAAGKRVWIWDRRDGGRLGSVALRGNPAEVVQWSSGMVAIRTRQGRVFLVDLGAERVARELQAPERVESIAADAAQPLVAAGLADGSVLVWNTTTGRLETRYEPHRGSVLALDVANGMLLTGAADGAAAVRNLQTGRTIALPGGHGNVVRAVDLSDDGRVAVTASADHTAKVWATADGRLISLLAGHDDVVADATFIDDARRVVTGGLDGTVRVWSSGTLEELAVADRGALHERSRDTRARSGARATAVDDVIRLRTAAGDVMTLRGHRDDVNSVAFSADGSLLVSASRDHDARIWDARTGEPIHQLEGHPGSVADARFSPDGRWVVTAGPISAGLWNVRTGELVSYLRGPTSRPVAVAFGPDSETIFSEEGEGVVRSYRCALCGTVADLRVIAERRLERAGQALSAEERARYLE